MEYFFPCHIGRLIAKGVKILVKKPTSVLFSELYLERNLNLKFHMVLHQILPFL